MSISYVVRYCNADFTSRNGFKWPELGEVVCPDFEATVDHGHGLHGFLGGCGDSSYEEWSDDAQWLLVAVPTDTIIHLDGAVKFPAGQVIFSSQDYLEVIAELERLDPEAKHMPVIRAVRSSKLKDAHILTGFKGVSTSGFRGTSISGDGGSSISGSEGFSISGEYGSSTSGDYGTSESGYGGTSVSGKYGTSIVGIGGYASSGKNGNLILFFDDDFGDRKAASFFVDGKIVKANKLYCCIDGCLANISDGSLVKH